MTEARILSKQPSIQNIQTRADSPKRGLTEIEINNLFVAKPLPKFQLVDLKMHSLFYRREKAEFFVSILERWNRRLQQSKQPPTNARTQFLMVQFIYSSLKRICLMNEHQIDKQLSHLYNWFYGQAKNNPSFLCPSMPNKKQQNEYYNVTKTFKTNPAIIIDEYRRPRIIQKQNKKQDAQKSLADLAQKIIKMKDKKYFNNNFITELQHKGNDSYMGGLRYNRQQKNENLKCLLLKRQSSKVRQQQLRNYLQKKQIEQQEWHFKLKKGRLLSENSKNYYNGKFNTTVRFTTSSKGAREWSKQKNGLEFKKIRLHTSEGKRSQNLGVQQNKEGKNVQLMQINNFGLICNPLESKLKKKKKAKK